MPDIHFFPTAKLPFFFTLSFLIAAYGKNKQTKKHHKDMDLLCTLAGLYRKMHRVLYTIYSDS